MKLMFLMEACLSLLESVESSSIVEIINVEVGKDITVGDRV